MAIGATSCSLHKKGVTSETDTTLIGEFDRGWLKYKFYSQPVEKSLITSTKKRKKDSGSEMLFSIKIVNMQDATSPLRKLSTNLDQYNVLYEYLLNQIKNDLTLHVGDKTLFPVYYAFENNYNVVPFETINVGYKSSDLKRRKKISTSLIYADKVFLHDTISCKIPAL